ncbi:MAG: type IIA DNA topoisomerase subunit B [Acidimicrobiales bacterium]
MTQGYDAADLQVLEGLDAVRKRPGMYIGGTTSAGLHHLLWELMDNAIDEAAAGHAKNVSVKLYDDGSVEVSDDGRGIPVDIEPTTGLTGLELVFTKLHAGGKFGGGAYAAAGGLHGVGAAVVNALSSKLIVEVDRSRRTYRLGFRDRVPGKFTTTGRFSKGSKLETFGRLPATRTGTRVRFWPDLAIFDEGASIDLKQVLDRARQESFLVPGLKISVTDERPEEAEKHIFRSERGLTDLVEFMSHGDPLSPVIQFNGEETFIESVQVIEEGHQTAREVERLCRVDVALRWVTGWDTHIRTFVNIIPTPGGGTHRVGFERALTKVCNEALRDLKVLKAKEPNATGDDVQEGLVAVVKITVPEPQFEGQTKETLGTGPVQSITYKVVATGLRDWFGGGGKKAQIKRVTDKIAAATRVRVAARHERDTMRRKSALESAAMPAKLTDCRSRDVERTELLIVEGDSAAGPAKKGRDSEFQAVLPIRGKILNAAKSSVKQVLDNAEAVAIFTAVGAGSGHHFDIEQARYGRIITLVDADVDGSHIRCLLLTLFYHYMRPMLEAGRIYAAMPPLHSIRDSSSKEYYAFSDKERDEIIGRLNAEGKTRLSISRFKGLGEMDVDELADTTLDPTKRTLRRITMADAESAAEVFDVLMGSEVAPRKEFIYTNSELMDRSLLDV